MNLTRVDHNTPNSTAHEAIPTTAGIYGWYYNFKTLKDLNGDVLSRQLENISRNLRRVDLKTTASAPLSTFYKGNLIEEYLLDFNKIKEKINNIDNNNNTKELITLLNDFAPPLYIGISVNLASRYKQHIDDLEFCDIIKGKNCFGQRARERAITKDYLSFKYYSMPAINDSSQKSIEFILNRFLKPVFGRK